MLKAFIVLKVSKVINLSLVFQVRFAHFANFWLFVRHTLLQNEESVLINGMINKNAGESFFFQKYFI